ncbi:MAG: imidazole glycerol phosphate synthase subunit HisH [Bacteroidetes bacterium]|nr:imidazole glycerol phosphate synthase subunit HisH [Bacteroidota bacterium]
MKVVIIKYNAGNVQSVLFALERIGVKGILSDNSREIQSADKVIFPGVGEASSAMQYLKEKKLDKVIKNLKQPTLGICLGMQLMCNHSEEGDTDCFGIFPMEVKKFFTTLKEEKIPQIGWNTVLSLKGKVFEGIKENEYMYFVHGYYAEKGNHTIATTNYILEYSSALQKNNFYGVQFHPEKSSEAGQKLLENFLKL